MPHVECSAVGPEQAGRIDHWAPGGLRVTSVAVADTGDLASLLADRASLAWIRRGEGLVGWGTAATIALPAGHDRFAAGEKWLREMFDTALVTDEVCAPGSGPVAFGSFTFDPTSDGSVLVIPSVVLARMHGRSWLTTIGAEPELTDAHMPKPEPLSPPTSLRWSDGQLTAPQ